MREITRVQVMLICVCSIISLCDVVDTSDQIIL